MSEVLAEIGGVRLTFTAVSAAVSAALLVLLAVCWTVNRKKTTGGRSTPGTWTNGIGFGLLPAAAAWKAFEHLTDTGRGRALIEPLPGLAWLTEGGAFHPCRIELAAAALCFAAMVLWLVLRREDLPDNGDLLPTAACLWAGIRIVTESFRPEVRIAFRYAYCGVMLACLLWWTVRRVRIRPGAARTAADWTAALLCMGMTAVTTQGILSAGSAIGDLAVITGCAALTAALTLIAGGDCRKMAGPASE